MARIIVAGVVGGLLVFAGGAFSHMFFDMETRHFKRLANESGVMDFASKEFATPAIYSYPMMAENLASMSADEQEKEWNRVNDLYKKGPNGTIIVGPTGEDMMSAVQLGGEAIADILAALLVSFVVYFLSSNATFPLRWICVVGIAVAGWLSLTASYALWYRFPWPFVVDGLLAALIEWGAAGIAIALIARPGRPQLDK